MDDEDDSDGDDRVVTVKACQGLWTCWGSTGIIFAIPCKIWQLCGSTSGPIASALHRLKLWALTDFEESQHAARMVNHGFTWFYMVLMVLFGSW